VLVFAVMVVVVVVVLLMLVTANGGGILVEVPETEPFSIIENDVAELFVLLPSLAQLHSTVYSSA
jgi:hypothetical protein